MSDVARRVFPHDDFTGDERDRPFAHRVADWVGVIATNRANAREDVERHLHGYLDRAAVLGRADALGACRVLWGLTGLIALITLVLLVR